MRLVTVAAYPDAIEAHLAISRLEAEGIRCTVADEHIIGADWFYSRAVGGVKVEVAPEDLGAARAILRDPGPPLEDPEEITKCPACGSGEIGPAWFSWRIAFLVVALWGIPIPWGRPMRCRDCGSRWRPQRLSSARTAARSRRVPSAGSGADPR